MPFRGHLFILYSLWQNNFDMWEIFSHASFSTKFNNSVDFTNTEEIYFFIGLSQVFSSFWYLVSLEQYRQQYVTSLNSTRKDVYGNILVELKMNVTKIIRIPAHNIQVWLRNKIKPQNRRKWNLNKLKQHTGFP